MRNTTRYLAVFMTVVLVIAVSIWGPEALAKYKDKGILDEPHIEQVIEAGEGYRYQMNANEKLYILARCIGSQVLSESEQNALTFYAGNAGLDYENLDGCRVCPQIQWSSGKEITDEQIYAACNEGLAVLKELNILPRYVRDVDAASYNATLYSAIDVLEPSNNVVVWKMELSNSQRNADKENRLIDAYIDADDGKIYEFYARPRFSGGYRHGCHCHGVGRLHGTGNTGGI